jgi:hypothetical protein
MRPGWLPWAVVIVIAAGVVAGAWLFGIVASKSPSG